MLQSNPTIIPVSGKQSSKTWVNRSYEYSRNCLLVDAQHETKQNKTALICFYGLFYSHNFIVNWLLLLPCRQHFCKTRHLGMGLLPDTQNWWLCMRRECWERFGGLTNARLVKKLRNLNLSPSTNDYWHSWIYTKRVVFRHLTITTVSKYYRFNHKTSLATTNARSAII